MKSSTNTRETIRNLVPKYKVTVHRDTDRFIVGIVEPERNKLAQELINDLPNYPDVLHRWDVEKFGAQTTSTERELADIKSFSLWIRKTGQ